jgi:hypothetical protein
MQKEMIHICRLLFENIPERTPIVGKRRLGEIFFPNKIYFTFGMNCRHFGDSALERVMCVCIYIYMLWFIPRASIHTIHSVQTEWKKAASSSFPSSACARVFVYRNKKLAKFNGRAGHSAPRAGIERVGGAQHLSKRSAVCFWCKVRVVSACVCQLWPPERSEEFHTHLLSLIAPPPAKTCHFCGAHVARRQHAN